MLNLFWTNYSPRLTRGCTGFALCVCVGLSVWVSKTDNFITTSHFAFTWGVWTLSGMSVCLFARLSVYPFVRPGPKSSFKRIETAQTHLKT